ncbi:MAG: dinuclear metal center YbgI/SA1388 family protein [Candidatus Marinamargulisbacteria bacterium]|jgi:dinuclear metal center YbgI/SA1388 family protein
MGTIMSSYVLNNLTQFLEEWAPLEQAARWDNCGMQLGDPDAMVQSVLLTVDIDNAVLQFLEETPVDLVISHHPLFFKPIKQIHYKRDLGRILKLFLSKDIHLYTMHTNLDVADAGVNDCLAKQYGFLPHQGVTISDGFGKWFENRSEHTFESLVKTLPCQIMGNKHPEKINRVAFGAGSGKSLVPQLVDLHVDLFITGELTHHDFVYCDMHNITVLTLGHGESEVFVLPEVEQRLKTKFKSLDISISGS